MMDKKGNLLISLDFELFWGLVDTRTINEYGEIIKGGRKAIPNLLGLFDRYDIHATWGTVGMLFASNKDELLEYLPDNKPDYLGLRKTSYEHFESIGLNEEEDSLHYANSLIKEITSYKSQEIGSHTFCHYYCREKGQNYSTFDADVRAAKRIAKEKFGLDMKSFIFPKNQFNLEYIKSLKDNNIITVRGNQRIFAYDKSNIVSRAFRVIDTYIPICGNKSYYKNECLMDDVVNLKASIFFRKYNRKLFFLEPLKMWNIKHLMTIAAKKGKIIHIWWHPHNMGSNPEKFLEQIEILLKHYKKLNEKYGLESKNMGEMAEEIINEKNCAFV